MKVTFFVSHHPGDLTLYKQKARKNDYLIKVNHEYYQKVDFPFSRHFVKVFELPFISYRKNVIAGLWQIRTFKKQLAVIKQYIDWHFKMDDEIEVLIEQSAWLPVNALLYFFSYFSRIKITRWYKDDFPTYGIDWKRTMFCEFYRLFISCFPVYATAINGKFNNFVYQPGKLPGKLKRITPFVTPKKDGQPIVIFFGDNDVFSHYEYLKENSQELLVNFLEKLGKQYVSVYYKPHPADKYTFKLPKHIQRFTERITTQQLLETYHVQAAYTVFSTSIVETQQLGIPSYAIYPMLYNKQGIKRFDEFFKGKHIETLTA